MRLFKESWGYAESFIIVAGILLFSIILETANNYQRVFFPGWPYNVIILVIYISILIIAYAYYRTNTLMKWISSVPASISSLVLFSLVALCTAIVPQTEDTGNSGLGDSIKHLQSSWLFIIPFIYFLTVLGLVVIRKSWNFKRRNLGFLANHFGLWLVLMTAGIGSPDLKKYAISLEEGKSTNMAFSEKGEILNLPFQIKLIDFHIDEFPPKVVMGQFSNNKIDKQLKNNPFLLEEGKIQKIGDYSIEIKEYLSSAKYDSIVGFTLAEGEGAVPAAEVSVKNNQGKKISEGWIACGGQNSPVRYISVDKNHFLTLMDPEPKKFNSTLEINSDNKIIKKQLIVNKPTKVKGWKLYQMSYDVEKGKNSNISVLQAVKDPWLPFVYTGFFLVIGGSVYLFWKGRNLR